MNFINRVMLACREIELVDEAYVQIGDQVTLPHYDPGGGFNISPSNFHAFIVIYR
jgi:hypothetical protein